MIAELTVTLSKDLSEKVQHAAQRRHQDVLDVVETLLSQALAEEDDDVIDLTEPDIGVEREIVAYRKLHPFLWQRYPGEYVAIRDRQLIDHDQDRVALSQRIRKRVPDQFVLIRQVDSKLERTLHFRSPRFAEAQL